MWGMSSTVRGGCGDDDEDGGEGSAGVAYSGTANTKMLFCLGITGRLASDLAASRRKKKGATDA